MSDSTNTTAEDPNEIVRVFHSNKIGGSLVHGPLYGTDGKPLLNEDGTSKEYRLGPGESVEVPRWLANTWLTHKNYGAPVCTLAPDQVAPARDALKAERDALSGENAALQDRIKAMESMLADLKAAQAGDGKPNLPATPPNPDDESGEPAKKKKAK